MEGVIKPGYTYFLKFQNGCYSRFTLENPLGRRGFLNWFLGWKNFRLFETFLGHESLNEIWLGQNSLNFQIFVHEPNNELERCTIEGMLKFSVKDDIRLWEQFSTSNDVVGEMLYHFRLALSPTIAQTHKIHGEIFSQIQGVIGTIDDALNNYGIIREQLIGNFNYAPKKQTVIIT